MKIKCCPIETALRHLGKKWTLNILRDMYFGKTRFNEFLKANPQLSTKMLSLRLKELEEQELIKKNIVGKTPVVIEYELTKKGNSLKGVLYELAKFSMQSYSGEVCNCTKKEAFKMVDKMFETAKA